MKTKPLLIGLVLDDTLDTPDGVQQYVITLGTWLAQQGHEVHYLVGETKRTDLPNIHSLARNKKVTYNGNVLSIPLPANKQALREVLAKHNFDVLHVQVPYSPFLAGRLIRLAPPQTAVVGSFHVMAYGQLVVIANRALGVINRRTAKRFDAMLANTQPAADFARQAYGFASQVVPNPFPLQQFKASGLKQSEVPTIVFLGRLVPRKGALQLLQAVAYLRQQQLFDGAFKVVIGGKGAELAHLQAFVHDNDLDEIVEFPGFIAEVAKADFLKQADIAVFPSLAGESFGISLLEALAAANGVVLGGDNPGYRAVLQPLGERHLVQPRDAADFGERLARWLINPADRQDAAKRQRHYVERFDVDHIGQAVSKVYQEALRQRRNVQ